MATVTQLLAQVTEPVSQQAGFAALGAIIDPLRCARFPRGQGDLGSPIRETPNHCRVLVASDVYPFHYAKKSLWVTYSEIVAAFKRSRGTSNITQLPEALVEAPIKVVLKDAHAPLQSVVVSERVYPKRAWMGALLPGYDVAMAYVVTGILNSAVGYLLYRQLAAKLGSTSDELAKAVLEGFPIPLPGRDSSAFSQAALLSYRLHMLYSAQTSCGIDLGDRITNHWLRLLSEVVELYGWSEQQAQVLLDEASASGLRDIPGYQGRLFFDLQSPLRYVGLLDNIDRYEVLKARARAKEISGAEAEELARYKRLVDWEDRINFSVPVEPTIEPWPGAATEKQVLKLAHRYLSSRRGQAYSAADPRRISPRLWEVKVYYCPPRNLKPYDVKRIPEAWISPGKHDAGHLWIDGITGEVVETPAEMEAMQRLHSAA